MLETRGDTEQISDVVAKLQELVDQGGVSSPGLTDTQLRATAVPVSGTVTSNLSATDNAVLDTIDAVLDAINAKLVTGTVIGDVNLGATDNAVLDAIAAKDFATQTTLAALNAKLVTGTVIGDVNLGATDNAVLDSIAADVLATKKATIGATAPTIDSYNTIAINLAAAADQSLVAAPGANKQIWVYGVGFTVNAAGTVSFQDEDNTAISGIMPVTTGMLATPSGNFAMPLWKVATNKALEVDIVTSEVDGWLSYAIVSV